jgi:hypothetical protein
MFRWAFIFGLVAAAIPAAASAGTPRFTEHTTVKPTGCPPAFAGGVVTLVDCVGRAPFAGTGAGTVDLARMSGALSKLAPRTRIYSSHSADSGMTVSLVVLG